MAIRWFYTCTRSSAPAQVLLAGVSVYALIPDEGACAYIGIPGQQPKKRFLQQARSKIQCLLQRARVAPRESIPFDAFVLQIPGGAGSAATKAAKGPGNLMTLLEFMAVEIGNARVVKLLNKSSIIGKGPRSKYGGPAAFLRKRCLKKGYQFDSLNAGK